MAIYRSTQDRARHALLSNLDYYVECLMVHTCQQHDNVLELLRIAQRDQLWLLLEWTHLGSPGAEETQDA